MWFLPLPISSIHLYPKGEGVYPFPTPALAAHPVQLFNVCCYVYCVFNPPARPLGVRRFGHDVRHSSKLAHFQVYFQVCFQVCVQVCFKFFVPSNPCSILCSKIYGVMCCFMFVVTCSQVGFQMCFQVCVQCAFKSRSSRTVHFYVVRRHSGSKTQRFVFAFGRGCLPAPNGWPPRSGRWQRRRGARIA